MPRPRNESGDYIEVDVREAGPSFSDDSSSPGSAQESNVRSSPPAKKDGPGEGTSRLRETRNSRSPKRHGRAEKYEFDARKYGTLSRSRQGGEPRRSSVDRDSNRTHRRTNRASRSPLPPVMRENGTYPRGDRRSGSPNRDFGRDDRRRVHGDIPQDRLDRKRENDPRFGGELEGKGPPRKRSRDRSASGDNRQHLRQHISLHSSRNEAFRDRRQSHSLSPPAPKYHRPGAGSGGGERRAEIKTRLGNSRDQSFNSGGNMGKPMEDPRARRNMSRSRSRSQGDIGIKQRLGTNRGLLLENRNDAPAPPFPPHVVTSPPQRSSRHRQFSPPRSRDHGRGGRRFSPPPPDMDRLGFHRSGNPPPRLPLPHRSESSLLDRSREGDNHHRFDVSRGSPDRLHRDRNDERAVLHRSREPTNSEEHRKLSPGRNPNNFKDRIESTLDRHSHRSGTSPSRGGDRSRSHERPSEFEPPSPSGLDKKQNDIFEARRRRFGDIERKEEMNDRRRRANEQSIEKGRPPSPHRVDDGRERSRRGEARRASPPFRPDERRRPESLEREQIASSRSGRPEPLPTEIGMISRHRLMNPGQFTRANEQRLPHDDFPHRGGSGNRRDYLRRPHEQLGDRNFLRLQHQDHPRVVPPPRQFLRDEHYGNRQDFRGRGDRMTGGYPPRYQTSPPASSPLHPPAAPPPEGQRLDMQQQALSSPESAPSPSPSPSPSASQSPQPHQQQQQALPPRAQNDVAKTKHKKSEKKKKKKTVDTRSKKKKKRKSKSRRADSDDREIAELKLKLLRSLERKKRLSKKIKRKLQNVDEYSSTEETGESSDDNINDSSTADSSEFEQEEEVTEATDEGSGEEDIDGARGGQDHEPVDVKPDIRRLLPADKIKRENTAAADQDRKSSKRLSNERSEVPLEAMGGGGDHQDYLFDQEGHKSRHHHDRRRGQRSSSSRRHHRDRDYHDLKDQREKGHEREGRRENLPSSSHPASHLRDVKQEGNEEGADGESRGGGGFDRSKEKPKSQAKPNMELSGKLLEDTNTYRGVVIKYSQPPEARIPKTRWRLYPFKGDEELPVLYIHRESAYLIGRHRLVCDIAIDHPSCSKQHAVLQYRLVPYKRDNGMTGQRVRPYIIDIGSTNGTYVNNQRIESQRFVELLEKDVLKFGFSSREYVILQEKSKDSDQDDDGGEAMMGGALSATGGGAEDAGGTDAAGQ